MASPAYLYLFGDQTTEWVPKLRELLMLRDHPLLTAFLDQAHFVIRAQMAQSLSPVEHKISRTSSLAELLQKYVEGKLSPAFQTALSTIAQLGSFMAHYQDPIRPYPREDEGYVQGSCTGSLPAAAISCSSSLSNLLPLAVQTILIAFRLGLRVTEMRGLLQNSDCDNDKPWSVAVFCTPTVAREAISTFCEQTVIPRVIQPWITATSRRTVTLSGPPHILAQLLQTPALSAVKSKPIPIFVPAHNSRISSDEDIRWILETTPRDGHFATPGHLLFLSGSTTNAARAGDFVKAMESALANCLLEPIDFEQIEATIPQVLHSRGVQSVNVVGIHTAAHKVVADALRAKGLSVAMDDGSEKMQFSHRPSAHKAKLAIVAYSGRFPESQSTDAFWDLLYKGLDVVKEVPERRWNVTTHVDATGKARNKGATKWGCWLDFYDQFDPRFFSISPKEAPQMDPAQRMALMSTYEAMERGGLVCDTTPSTQRNRWGVFHGVTSNDWMETNTAQNIDTYFITGGNRGFIPGRINFCFEFSGPSYTNDTACSSSLAAIHLACNSLWRGDCDTAVAGGTNMIFTPDGHTGLDKGFFLSRTGNCKAFDDAADGYCRAEGVGTVIIKRLEDALADNDPIVGMILDAKTNHSAMSESMTRPHVGAQIDNMTSVLANANVDPQSVSYVEMHGTGTQVGDAVEMESVLSVFAPNEHARGIDRPLHVGSAKANIGHGEGVSGVTSLVKVLMMMENDTVPPHCGIKPGSKINHNYPDLGARNVHIALEPKPWIRTDSPRRVLINNFSAAGGNTALLIEDAPVRNSLKESDPRTSHTVTVSGHVGKSARGNLVRLLAYIKQHPDVSLSELSYTTTARRWHHLHRIAVTGSSLEAVVTKLEAAVENGDGNSRPKFKPNLLFAFTGQGSQYPGMGAQLYEAYPTFRADLHSFAQLARRHGFPDFLEAYDSSGKSDMNTMPPVSVQLAVTCLEMALFNLLASWGIRPSAVVGHSLGEYAALFAAGVLSASDTIYLVGHRAKLFQQHCQSGTHAMLAVQVSQQKLAQLLQGTKCEIACINGPDDVVFSGSTDDVRKLQRACQQSTLKNSILQLPYAFHSAQVDPIIDDFQAIASAVVFGVAQLPILSPLEQRVIKEGASVDASYLARHCRAKVDFVAALHAAKCDGIFTDRTMSVEIGPKPLVCGMIRMTLGMESKTFPTLKQGGDPWANLQNLVSSLYSGGHDVNWPQFHSPFAAAKHVLRLPDYDFDLKEYYIPYVGDWCLHRHPLKCDCATPGSEVATSAYVVPTPEPSKKPAAPYRPSKLDASEPAFPEIKASTTLHRVVEEKTEPLGATLIVETDISRKDVNGLAQGHTVDGIPLATPSFYADIAMQVGRYSMQRLRAGHPGSGARDGLVDVCDLVVDTALIPHGQTPQLLRTTLTMKWPPKAAATCRSAKVAFATYFADGKLDTKHASCTVRFTTDSQLKSLTKNLSEYQASIKRLYDEAGKGRLAQYTTKSGYKLMSSMAQFHADYKLLNHLVLDESKNEAVSTMEFTSAKVEGDFAAHPAYVDAITQVGGFAMNAKDDTDISTTVYVNHGWDSFQVYKPLVKGVKYTVHSKMDPDPKGDLVHGDTIVLQGDEIVAFFRGLSLRSVPRRALRAVLEAAWNKGLRQRGGKPAPATASSLGGGTKQPAASPGPEKAKGKVTPIAESIDKKATQTPKKSSHAANEQIVQAVLKVISEESGVSLDELTDDTNFVDMGIDSLSSMTIGGRMREDLAIELDPNFSLFANCPTVRSLRDFLGSSAVTSGGDEVLDSVDEAAEICDPDTDGAFEGSKCIDEAEDSKSNTNIPPSQAVQNSQAVADALRIVSEESGVAMEDLTDETIFTDIGIDSLCSMSISSRFREELDLDTELNIFVDLPTVGQLRAFFGGTQSSESPVSNSEEANKPDHDVVLASVDPEDGSSSDSHGENTDPGEDSSTSDTSGTEDDDEDDAEYIRSLNLQPYCRPTPSVTIQGIPKMAKKTLFMLPDGGGSASSYLPIPRLGREIAMVGLNCPYGRDPERMNCTWQAMIESFVNEIQRRQPHGPYHLGGWSSGGAFAYVTAEALVNKGEEVGSLIILDAPVPQKMEKLPESFYQHCNKVGLFANQPGGGRLDTSEPPPYLIPHFIKVVDVMLDYKVKPLQTDTMPKVGLLWAAETVMDEKDAPKMKGMHFMIQKRKDFGPDGWDRVLPGAKFDIVKADGINHFSIMAPENVHLVSELIQRVMA